MSISVYLAAAFTERASMIEWAAMLRANGLHVVSEWHNTVATVDPVTHDARQHILYENLVGIAACDVMVVDTRHGLPCATFSEIGWALGAGKFVIWLMPPTRRPDGVRANNIFDSHARCERIIDPALILPRLMRMAVVAAAPTGQLPPSPDDSGSFAGVG